MNKICRKCKKEFKTDFRGKLYCGELYDKSSCAYKRKRERKRKDYMTWYAKNGNDLNNKKRKNKVCIKCKEKITSSRIKYCNKCVKEKRVRKLRLRFRIFLRDNFTCRYCGRKTPEVKLEIDHIHPRSKGGLNNENNYQTLCRECNIGKGNFILK